MEKLIVYKFRSDTSNKIIEFKVSSLEITINAGPTENQISFIGSVKIPQKEAKVILETEICDSGLYISFTTLPNREKIFSTFFSGATLVYPYIEMPLNTPSKEKEAQNE